MSDVGEWEARYLREATALMAQLGGGSIPTREPPLDEGFFVRGAPDAIELVYVERGRETIERFTSVDALVFTVLRHATFGMAVAYELAHRRAGVDTRRLAFARELELMTPLGAPWVARLEAHHAAILAVHPFDDLLAQRADRWNELMSAGLSRDEAVAQATRELAGDPIGKPE